MTLISPGCSMTNSLPLLSRAAANPTGRSNPPAITSQVNRSAAGSLSTFAGVGVETGLRCGVSAGGRAVLLSLGDVCGMGVTVKDGVSVSEGVALRVFTGVGGSCLPCPEQAVISRVRQTHSRIANQLFRGFSFDRTNLTMLESFHWLLVI